MASVALPARRRSRSYSETRPSTSPAIPQVSSAHAHSAVSPRPPHSFSRPHPPKINIDTHTFHKPSTPRKGSGNLALQAKDSVSVRKRTLSTGAMSARLARQTARKARAGLLQVCNAYHHADLFLTDGPSQTRIPETRHHLAQTVAVKTRALLPPRPRRVQTLIAIGLRALRLLLHHLPLSRLLH